MEMPFNPITTGSPVIMPKAVPAEPKKKKDARLNEIKTHVHSLSQIIGKAGSATEGDKEVEFRINATRIQLNNCQEMIQEIEKIKSPDLQEKKIAFLKSAAWVGVVALAAFGAVAAAITFPAVPMATLGALLLLTAALIVIKEGGESFGKDAGVISDDSSFIKKAVVTFGLAPFMPLYEIYQENQDNKAQVKKAREGGMSKLEPQFDSLKKSFNDNYANITNLLGSAAQTEKNRLGELEEELKKPELSFEKKAELQEEFQKLHFKMHQTGVLSSEVENLHKLFNPGVSSGVA